MIYLPKGIKNGEVVDPEKISRDYVEANRIASDTTQYQWREDEFNDITKFDESVCKVHYASTVAKMNVTIGNEPILVSTTPLSVPNTSAGTSSVTRDTNFFEVPLNRGFFEVPIAFVRPDGSTDTKITWESNYPELVHITLSYQYVRRHTSNYAKVPEDGDAQPGDATYSKYYKLRLQTAIDIDGYQIVGSGPGGVNLEESYRGLGFAGRSLVTSVNVVQLLPAGVHTVKAVAALLPIQRIKDNESNLTRLLAQFHIGLVPGSSGDRWGTNVCIGNRNLIVARYGRGKLLRT